MTELELGQAMLRLARSERHRPKMPPPTADAGLSMHAEAVRRHVEHDGMTHAETGRALGISRSRVTQICAVYDIGRTRRNDTRGR